MFSVKNLEAFAKNHVFCNGDSCEVVGMKFSPNACIDCDRHVGLSSHGCHLMSHLYVGIDSLLFMGDDSSEAFRNSLSEFIAQNKRDLAAETLQFVAQKQGVQSIGAYAGSVRNKMPKADELFLHCCTRFTNRHIRVHFANCEWATTDQMECVSIELACIGLNK